MCTVCSQLNNKPPVRFGPETASRDKPAGHIQLLSLLSCLGCLLVCGLGDALLELQLLSLVWEKEVVVKCVTTIHRLLKLVADFIVLASLLFVCILTVLSCCWDD